MHTRTRAHTHTHTHFKAHCACIHAPRQEQGDFDRRSKIVATIINATGLHASEIVPLEVKDVRKFETKIVKTIWGPSRPGRAREIIFCLLCPGHRVSPTMLIAYQRALWLSCLCRSRGPALITAQAVSEANPTS